MLELIVFEIVDVLARYLSLFFALSFCTLATFFLPLVFFGGGDVWALVASPSPLHFGVLLSI